MHASVYRDWEKYQLITISIQLESKSENDYVCVNNWYKSQSKLKEKVKVSLYLYIYLYIYTWWFGINQQIVGLLFFLQIVSWQSGPPIFRQNRGQHANGCIYIYLYIKLVFICIYICIYIISIYWDWEKHQLLKISFKSNSKSFRDMS